MRSRICKSVVNIYRYAVRKRAYTLFYFITTFMKSCSTYHRLIAHYSLLTRTWPSISHGCTARCQGPMFVFSPRWNPFHYVLLQRLSVFKQAKSIRSFLANASSDFLLYPDIRESYQFLTTSILYDSIWHCCTQSLSALAFHLACFIRSFFTLLQNRLARSK